VRAAPAALFFVAALAGALSTSCGPKCGPDRVCTVVGNGEAELDPGEGTAARATALFLPIDLTFGPDGAGYLIDWNNHRIRRWDLVADTVTTVVGNAMAGFGPPGPLADASLNHPTALAFDATGGMLIAGWHNGVVWRADLANGILEVVAGTGLRGFSGDEGPATEASLDLPVSVAVDADGNVYVADQGNNRVRMIDTAGIIHTVAGTGLGTGVDPTGYPLPECVGASIIGTVDCWVDGPVATATLNAERGQAAEPCERIVLGPDGALYVADTANNAVRRIDFAADSVTTVAGLGPLEPGYSGDGGPAVAARLYRPTDLELAPDGTLYVADTDNHCLRAIAPDGTISTVAGTCGTSGPAEDGVLRDDALFYGPYGVALGPDGYLYVADTKNSVIRAVHFGTD
jgi:sugar lactone lactonase YvrE